MSHPLWRYTAPTGCSWGLLTALSCGRACACTCTGSAERTGPVTAQQLICALLVSCSTVRTALLPYMLLWRALAVLLLTVVLQNMIITNAMPSDAQWPLLDKDNHICGIRDFIQEPQQDVGSSYRTLSNSRPLLPLPQDGIRCNNSKYTSSDSALNVLMKQ